MGGKEAKRSEDGRAKITHMIKDLLCVYVYSHRLCAAFLVQAGYMVCNLVLSLVAAISFVHNVL